MKTTHSPYIRTFVSLATICACLLTFLTGCSTVSITDPALMAAELNTSIQDIQSVETHISFEMQGTFKNSADYNSHSASIGSDVTIQSTYSPLAYAREGYSNILVDGVTTRENKQNYVVPDGNDYINYEYLSETGEWEMSILSHPEILMLAGKTGLIQDWTAFMSNMKHTSSTGDGTESLTLVYSGTVDSSIINQVFAEPIFGSFMTSLEWLVQDNLSCTLYVDGIQYLPKRFEVSFQNEFAVTDMVFNKATITVEYSDWNTINEISVPKQGAVMAINPDEAFYSTYYSWNLFLPYVGGQLPVGTEDPQSGQSFTADWSTFQVRIDGGMTSVPLLYEDLQKIGYDIEDKYSSYIMEPNKYVEDVIVSKGQDKIRCAFYNDDVVAQPISSCKIGAIDIRASDQPNNGIKIYLPGEITLGITRDTLESAYGAPDYAESAFSSDTLTWKGASDLQYFLAEISPITGQVIRLKIFNVATTGGVQY